MIDPNQKIANGLAALAQSRRFAKLGDAKHADDYLSRAAALLGVHENLLKGASGSPAER